MTIEFLLTSLVVVLVPGAGVLYTLAHGLSLGSRASIIAALGCTFGIVPHLAAAIFGLAALLHTSAMIFQIVKFAGVAYLLYMAWGILQEKGALNVEGNVKARPWIGIATKGVLVNILNPKLSIFFLAFLPQFIDPASGSVTIQMLGLGGVFMVMTFVVFVGYGLFASAVRSHVISKPNVMAWLRRTFAGAFVIVSAKLALSDN
ncbi:MAG: LysE family translocator [Rhodospirillales bacterium]|nr:LysE family translocator [Rhodospirillales bacterium]